MKGEIVELVKFTESGQEMGDKAYVHPAKVVLLRASQWGGTEIHCDGGHQITVTERLDEVYSRLRNFRDVGSGG